jgi:hypothetical protein
MGRSFNTARFPNGEAPSILAIVPTAAQTFKKGALVKQTGAGTISERTAVTDKVSGVALQDAFSGYGANAANSPTVITGSPSKSAGSVSVAIADKSTVFSCRGVNGGTDPAIPVQANIGVTYGVLKTGGGDWVLDLANTTNLVAQVQDIDAALNIFFVKITDAFRDYV